MIPREPQLDYWKAIARIVRRCFLPSLTCNDISPLELATWVRRRDSQVRKMQDLSVEFWLLDCGEDTGGRAPLLMLSWPHLCELLVSVTSLSGHHPVGQSQSFESLLRSTDWGQVLAPMVPLNRLSLHSNCHTPHPKHHCYHPENFP